MTRRPSFASWIALLALFISIAGATQQGSYAQPVPQAVIGQGFTYQGRLADAGAPANGSYDFEFALFDALTGGDQVGTMISRANVVVSDGLFSAVLDFGNPFWTQQLYLEVRVRAAGGTSYTTLSPRQALSPAPVASALPGVYTSQNEQFVGIGRNNRITSNEVFGVTADKGASGNTYGGMYVNTVSPDGRPFYGYATGATVRAWTTYDPATSAWGVHTLSGSRFQVGPGGLFQPSGDQGLVKAGVFANCSSASPTIIRSFRNVIPTPPSPVAITWNNTLDGCVIEFGFPVNYYVATANAAEARIVTCAFASTTSLYCKRFTTAGVRENGNITLLIY
jgi:hypothetical protein